MAVFLAAAFNLAAEDTCPYMNEATAAGILGGEVKGSFISASKDNDDGSCSFKRTQQSGQAELRIDVTTMTDHATQFAKYLAQCKGRRSPLTGIGNEAVVCSESGKDAMRIELVVGRVRERAFVITLRTSDHTLTEAGLRAKSLSAAEQVSGFLF